MLSGKPKLPHVYVYIYNMYGIYYTLSHILFISGVSKMYIDM